MCGLKFSRHYIRKESHFNNKFHPIYLQYFHFNTSSISKVNGIFYTHFFHSLFFKSLKPCMYFMLQHISMWCPGCQSRMALVVSLTVGPPKPHYSPFTSRPDGDSLGVLGRQPWRWMQVPHPLRPPLRVSFQKLA